MDGDGRRPAACPPPLSHVAPWDAVAAGYAEDTAPLLERYAATALRLADLGVNVLDVACGPGTLALLAARDARRVVAVDVSEAMLRGLARRAAAEDAGSVEAVLADGQALPFEDGTFDGVFSMFGLMSRTRRPGSVRRTACSDRGAGGPPCPRRPLPLGTRAEV